jgi:hypothetical protein
MKSKDLRKVVFRKYKDGDGICKIFRDLNSALVLNTIKRWCKMIRDTAKLTEEQKKKQKNSLIGLVLTFKKNLVSIT